MKVLLIVATGRARHWMRDLAQDLTALGMQVRTRATPGSAPSTMLRLALELDRLLAPSPRHRGQDAVAIEAIAPPADTSFVAEAVVDLTDDPKGDPTAADAVATLAVAFDGWPGEDAAASALTRHGNTTVEIFDPTTGAVLERARPSLEGATGLAGALSMVGSRAGALIAARLAARRNGRERPRLPGATNARGPRATVSFAPLAEGLARRLARRVHHLVCHAPHWRVGWRFIDGPGLAETGSFAGPRFRPIADPGLHCYADPFPVTWDGRTHVLVEDFDHATARGCISAVPFDETGPIGPAEPILEEPWHLSYPFPVIADGVLHLVPESIEHDDVALYRCIAYPNRWERVATLLTGVKASDVTILRRGDRWWMFSTLDDGRGGWSDMLAIHSAPSLYGPWTPHRDVPLKVDATAARAAGAPFVRDGRLFRPVQDCGGIYGGGVDVVEVTRLDDETHHEEVRVRLRPGPAWPGRRLHTLNRLGRLEVIDGAVLRPKWDALDRWVASRRDWGGQS